jgi:hypothetical protein
MMLLSRSRRVRRPFLGAAKVLGEAIEIVEVAAWPKFFCVSALGHAAASAAVNEALNGVADAFA